jgi:hypothetical protein
VTIGRRREGDRPHLRHFATIYAGDDDEARHAVRERWLASEPELQLQIVRVDGDRLAGVPMYRKGGFV